MLGGARVRWKGAALGEGGAEKIVSCSEAEGANEGEAKEVQG